MLMDRWKPLSEPARRGGERDVFMHADRAVDRLTPIPVCQQIHQKQVLALYCCILPFCLVDEMGWYASQFPPYLSPRYATLCCTDKNTGGLFPS